MKITRVEQQRNLGRFNIFLNGEFAFGADEDLVVNRQLVLGREISETELSELLQESSLGKLIDRVYRLLSVRARSEGEIRDYFRRLSFKRKLQGDDQINQIIVDQLIERLKKRGLINDLEFAKSWFESRRRSKKLGPRALRIELIKKGISREIIDSVITGETRQSDEQLAQEALEKRINRWKNHSPLEFRKKATDYLLRKGFDYETVKKVLG